MIYVAIPILVFKMRSHMFYMQIINQMMIIENFLPTYCNRNLNEKFLSYYKLNRYLLKLIVYLNTF